MAGRLGAKWSQHHEDAPALLGGGVIDQSFFLASLSGICSGAHVGACGREGRLEMGRDARQRQKARVRKVERRKAKRRRHGGGSNGRRVQVAAVPQDAGRWPLHEALISKDWDSLNGSRLVEVLVARRGPAGEIAAGICLVDLGCLGVKSAFARLFSSRDDYEYSKSRLPTQKIAIGFDLAVKVIRTGIAYAAELGFAPDPDLAEVEPLLVGAQPALCDVPVPLGGDDAKPFYVAGPHDDVATIMTTLSRRLGGDGFHFIAPLAGDLPFAAFDNDGDEEWELDDGSPLGSIDGVRLVEPVSVASVSQWLSRRVRGRATV